MAEWTRQYPKEPGYYWLRNYTVQRHSRQEYVSEPAIVDVDSNLRVHIEGEDPIYFGRDIISAEWLGPIQPQEYTDRELLTKFLDYIYHLLRDKSACYVAIDSFLQIQLPPEDNL